MVWLVERIERIEQSERIESFESIDSIDSFDKGDKVTDKAGVRSRAPLSLADYDYAG